MPFTDIRGNRYYYEDVGPESGEAVILVHGYTGAGSDWATIVPALSRGYRCIVPDQRGFGRSEHPRPRAAYTMFDYVEDIAALASQLGIERFHLAGVSMGGMIAQEFALAHQERLLSLALVDTAPELPRVRGSALGPDDMETYLRDHTLEQYWTYAAEVRAKQDPPPPPRSPEATEASRRRFLANNSPAGIVGAAAMMEAWPGVRGRLGEIRVRTLVVVGSLDAPFLEPAHDLANLLPDARLVVIPNCGHVPMFDAPDTFNRVYLDFLEGRGGQG